MTAPGIQLLTTGLVAGLAVGLLGAGAVVGAFCAMRPRPATLRQVYGWYRIALGIANWINFKAAERIR